MTPWRRSCAEKSRGSGTAIGFRLWRSARDKLTAHLSASHPEWSEEPVRREVARLGSLLISFKGTYLE